MSEVEGEGGVGEAFCFIAPIRAFPAVLNVKGDWCVFYVEGKPLMSRC